MYALLQDKVKAMLGKVASRKRSAELAWDVGDKSLDRIGEDDGVLSSFASKDHRGVPCLTGELL